MAIKIFPYLVALFALLYVVQAAPSEQSELPEALYIASEDSYDSDPAVLSPQEALSGPFERSSRSCVPARCEFICRRQLGFRRGRCIGSSCICSN